jgi:hypothetical protein
MQKNGAFSKILAVIGTVLVWLPLLAPLALGLVSLGASGIYRLDYLMPAELSFVVFAGGALLLWAAIRARAQRRIIAWGLGIAAVSLITLISFNDVIPGSLEWAVVIGLLIVYVLSIVGMGVGGVLLWRGLFRS